MNRCQTRTALFSSLLLFAQLSAGQLQATPSVSSCVDTALEAADKIISVGKPDSFVAALELYQQALNCDPSPAKPKEAEILSRIGVVQFSLARYQDAFTNFKSSAELFSQIPEPEHKRYLEEEARALLNEALALRSLLRIDEALVVYQKARSLYHTIDDKRGESRVWGDLSHMSFLMGEYRSALDYCDHALALLKEIPSDGRADSLRAYFKDLRGRIYFQLNQPALAKSNFYLALTLAKKNYQLYVPLILNDLGLLALKEGRPKIARDLHQQALDHFIKFEPPNTDGIAETKCYLADSQRMLREYDAATRNYQQALSLQEHSGDAIGEAQTRVSLGITEMELHRPEEALESLAKAVDLYHRVSDRAGESMARFQIAKIQALRGVESAAIDEANQAIRLAEEMRNFTPRGLRVPAFASLEEMYRFQINLILRNKVISSSAQALSFDLVQRARARALLDLLQNRMSDNHLSCGQDLASRWKLTVNSLEKLNHRLEGQLAFRGNEVILRETLDAIKDLETSRDEIETQCQQTQPKLALFASPAMSFAEIQDELLDDEDAVFVQFYLANPDSYAWIIAKKAVSIVRLPPADVLDTEVKSTLRFGQFGEWTQSQRTALDALYAGLAPVFNIARVKRWIVVADGALQQLPFAFFSIKTQWPQQVVKIPSASAIRAVRNNLRDGRPLTKVVVFADPVYDAQDSRVIEAKTASAGQPASNIASSDSKARQSTPGYVRLLYSRREAKAIARLLPKGQATLFLDFAANLRTAGSDLSGYRILHFATHSLVNERQPDISRIVLSLVTRGGRPRPGYLLQKDIYQMRLKSDLVVLSSCRSAEGSPDTGEGTLSLARAFLFAGSKSVLASHWQVDDEATAEMMTRFYRHIFKDGLPAIQALARTQTEFRTHGGTKSHNPLYWAGFELYGDWHDTIRR